MKPIKLEAEEEYAVFIKNQFNIQKMHVLNKYIK
jgi:hypothetical protein